MSLSFGDNLSCIDADEGQMFQVLSNLIINAKQAMPKGGNITIEAKDVILDENSMSSPTCRSLCHDNNS